SAKSTARRARDGERPRQPPAGREQRRTAPSLRQPHDTALPRVAAHGGAPSIRTPSAGTAGGNNAAAAALASLTVSFHLRRPSGSGAPAASVAFVTPAT